MGEFGNSVAHRFVGDAGGAVAAVDVGDADAGDGGRGGGGKCFDPIAEHDDNIGRVSDKSGGESAHAAAKRSPSASRPDWPGNCMGIVSVMGNWALIRSRFDSGGKRCVPVTSSRRFNLRWF